MQTVDYSAVDHILDGWDRLLKDYPDMKRELLENVGDRMLSDVQQRIGGSGKVQGWQDTYVGSRLGYVAARAKAETYQTTRHGTRYTVGYITNAIENGHKNRRPQQRESPGYHYTKGRIKTAAAAGKHFYAGARQEIGRLGGAELRRMAEEIARRLEGT